MFALFSVAAFVLLIDQLTKLIAIFWLKPQGSITVIPGIFHLNYVENTGIAFGFFQEHPEILFYLIVVSVIGLLIGSRYLVRQRFSEKLAYGFILGGAIGNLVDRIRFQHVIDFLDFRVWPVFNLADSFISIGVFLFIFFALKRQ